MKFLAIGFLVSVLGGAIEVEPDHVEAKGAAEVESNDLPSLEGLKPSEIEKIMVEELLTKPKEKKGNKGSKAPVTFEATVRPILKQFKKQLLDDKKEMQKQLDDDIVTIKKCITKMQKSIKAALLETGKPKAAKEAKKAKCPAPKDVIKCTKKINKLKPLKYACKNLEAIGNKDIDNIKDLIHKWNKQKIAKKDCVQDKGEQKLHYVSRLAKHFKKKLEAVQKRVDEMANKKMKGKKFDARCFKINNVIRHLTKVTCKKISDADYGCKCEKVIKEKKICGIHDGCYSASVLQYVNNKKEIEIKNAAAKLEWRAVGRIECLLKVMSGKDKADAKQLEKCVVPDAKRISTKPLDLNYPKIPPKPKCAVPGLQPNVRKSCVKGAEIKDKKKKR